MKFCVSGHQRLAWRGEGAKSITWLPPPHIAQDLDVTRDLLLGSLNAVLVEVVDEELIPPPTAITRVGSPGRAPVIAKT